MKTQFHPLQGKKGEFRVALNLSELGDRAWEILSLSQQLGLGTPKFAGYTRESGVIEVWAILLQQFHDYGADPAVVVDVWDDALAQLRQAIGQDNELNLIMLCNLQAYLQPIN